MNPMQSRRRSARPASRGMACRSACSSSPGLSTKRPATFLIPGSHYPAFRSKRPARRPMRQLLVFGRQSTISFTMTVNQSLLGVIRRYRATEAELARLEASVMSTAKEELTRLIQRQPDDSSSEEIVRELAFHVMVERGIADSDAKRTISNEEMGRRIRSWQK
jgi:hypothetical protein